mmetsp:Transcript_18521/g.49565  ORF Transcript_18521/g.49565 Transcript_18521/m.49565 type:complete len:397 (-) Transcript_18521:677-1867(-)
MGVAPHQQEEAFEAQRRGGRRRGTAARGMLQAGRRARDLQVAHRGGAAARGAPQGRAAAGSQAPPAGCLEGTPQSPAAAALHVRRLRREGAAAVRVGVRTLAVRVALRFPDRGEQLVGVEARAAARLLLDDEESRRSAGRAPLRRRCAPAHEGHAPLLLPDGQRLGVRRWLQLQHYLLDLIVGKVLPWVQLLERLAHVQDCAHAVRGQPPPPRAEFQYLVVVQAHMLGHGLLAAPRVGPREPQHARQQPVDFLEGECVEAFTVALLHGGLHLGHRGAALVAEAASHQNARPGLHGDKAVARQAGVLRRLQQRRLGGGGLGLPQLGYDGQEVVKIHEALVLHRRRVGEFVRRAGLLLRGRPARLPFHGLLPQGNPGGLDLPPHAGHHSAPQQRGEAP